MSSTWRRAGDQDDSCTLCGETHVRVKRGRTIMMITIDLAGGATAGNLKDKLEVLVGRDAKEQRLFYEHGEGEDKERRILQDERELVEQGIENDAVIFLVLKKGDSWEEIDVAPFSEDSSERHIFRLTESLRQLTWKADS